MDFFYRRTVRRPGRAALVALAAGILASGATLALISGVAAAAGPDPVGTIYVADYGTNSIDVFAPGANGNVAPIRTISGGATLIDGPGDVKVDSAGDVFVVNYTGNSVTEYAPGASGNAAPICTIQGSNTGLDQPDDMSLAADGTLYVGNLYANTAEVFAPSTCGNVTPLRVIAGSATGFNDLDGLGVDASGTLYADSTLNSSIQVFAPGANGNVAPTYNIAGSNTGLSYPDDVVVDFFGKLYVTDGFSSGVNNVEVFAAGSSGNVAPIQAISGSNTDFGNPDDLAVDATGNIYVTDSTATVGPAVLEWASGATGNVAPAAIIAGPATTFSIPEGVAVVLPPPPTLTTTTSSSSIALGNPTNDTASLSGGTSPTGSIEFKLFGPGDPTCSAAPAYTSPLSTVAGNGSYTSSSFTPTAPGTYGWVALYSGDANNAPVSTACGDRAETVTVKAPTITLTGTPVSATEGEAFSGQVASFTDTNTTSTAAEYSAIINWGDATTSAGTVSGPTGGPYTVDGSHTYAEEGSYTVGVSITDTNNVANALSTSSTATVADAPITATCATAAVSLQSFSGTVASLSDANAGAPTSDFTATINWGDGSPTSTGTVTGSGGSYSIAGSHSYSSTGYYNITTAVTDDGGSTSTTSSCKVLVFAFAPGRGAFVIGDGNSANGTAVTFWGAQWWKLNTLSGGAAPAAFKGYALNPAVPSCGTNWSTDPGNSAPPPAGPLPAYMGVIVSSKTSMSGSQISGDTLHIVVVQTNTGYKPNPGHAGTGTVIAQVCPTFGPSEG